MHANASIRDMTLFHTLDQNKVKLSLLYNNAPRWVRRRMNEVRSADIAYGAGAHAGKYVLCRYLRVSDLTARE